ncbi:MAG: cysteine desulfurase family protein [Anaerovoracaceae bacterium]
MIYLDNSATTRQDDKVTEIMIKYMSQDFGNPSSLYSLGITGEKAIKKARAQILKAMGQNSGEFYFTSGGTEADNMAIFGAAEAKKKRGNKIITSKVEHPAVLEACKRLEKRGWNLVYIDVDKECKLNMDQLKRAIDEETVLITIMQVNNETGAIMPIEEIANLRDQVNKDILLHTDSVQAFGKIPIPKCADMISISGHKIHGPKGIGGLYVKDKVNISPFVVGGGQEKSMRSGTENVPGIAGFGESAQLIAREINGQVTEVKDYLLKAIENNIKDIKVNGPKEGVGSILNISFKKTRAEVILHTLEQDEIYISTGSACSSNKKGQSHVLQAMGLEYKDIESALRFSLNPWNTKAEMDVVVDKLKLAVEKFRKLGSFR